MGRTSCSAETGRWIPLWSHMISEKRIFLFRIVLYPNAPTSCWMMPEISRTRSNIRRIGPNRVPCSVS
ncbi:hypothetical protein BGCPKDLD_2842 [Methylorubrum suomiense]|uniref:Uncharacterized protein n=1 Tax=Methylorubrum suomiense TaxID=144191 RepID=A0ABQ4UW64_9HYPH|nr:hypothetical protein BGCPKDLD_2842 [Methylorubrum suomiense]